MRAVKLLNYKTGKIISTKSIVSFCKRAHLFKNAKYHITPILSGSRLHYKGWCLPRNKFLRASIVICDVYGNEYFCEHPVEFAKKYKKNPMKIVQLIKVIYLMLLNQNGLKSILELSVQKEPVILVKSGLPLSY